MDSSIHPLLPLIYAEIDQAVREGKNVDREAWHKRLAQCDPQDDLALEKLYRELAELQPLPDFPFREPNALKEIQSLRPATIERAKHVKPPKSLHDRMLGGWTGLACGCMLGKPFEIPFYIKGSLAERAARTRQWLETSKSWPLDNYVPQKNRVGETFGLEIGQPECCREHLKAMQPDARFDMMLISLATLERSGLDFTTRDVVETWLGAVPYQLFADAEKRAYLSLMRNERLLQGSDEEFDWGSIARRLNPWREDGTAMMRGIIHGFASPGKPWMAAEMAWRDTRLSYCANGLYGAMLAAAMASAAFYESDPIALIETGIAEIPPSSRLARLAKRILALGKSNPEWSSALQVLDKEIEEPLGSHIAGSAASVLLGLIYGRGNFGTSISIAVSAGGLTSVNGAVTGAILGVAHGAKYVPAKWSTRLHNTIYTPLAPGSHIAFTDCAKRTLKVMEKEYRKN